MPLVRTVLGDIDPSELGVTYAHEHLVIDGGRPVELEPDFLLADVERMATEVREAAALGLRSVIDAMPADAGRNATKLAELSRQTGVNIVAPTGLHHERYYGPAHWSLRIGVEELAGLFTADVEEGIDANDYSGPVVWPDRHPGGVVKVAGSSGGLSPRGCPCLCRGGPSPSAPTGVPILTHCGRGTARSTGPPTEDLGVPATRVTLSHVDKVVDRGYHRELLATGASAEYDQAFRWGDRENGTLTLLEAMIGDGFADGTCSAWTPPARATTGCTVAHRV